jgi:phosphoglucosamine mutase
LDLVERLGRAFGLWARGGTVLIGRDTRASGVLVERALSFGLVGAGMEVRLGGVLPTPAVPLLEEGYGAVISASHNPPEYNGVKFFTDDGRKLTDAEEEQIEEHLDGQASNRGTQLDEPGLAHRYIEIVCERFGAPLQGLRIAVDCANGAMYEVAPAAFERLGAHVTAIGIEPNGTNINVGCGATDLRSLRETVSRGDFDLGVAFDGDGDRMLAVDASGNELDGDQILAIVALHLGVDFVAVTQMTNLGFHRLMKERNIRVVTTDVGDRYVLEALRSESGVLGGEQSGHVVYLNGHTTGDGLVAAILLCRAVVEQGKSLAELAAVMPKLPQAKADVAVRSKEIPTDLQAELDELAKGLGETARILVRPSGTEPVIRILAEAETPAKAEKLCGTIRSLVLRELG